MPRKPKPEQPRAEILAPISADILDQIVRDGPLTAADVETATRRFKKALIERALGAELSHHLGYAPGTAKPEVTSNHRDGTSGKTVLTDRRGLSDHHAPDVPRPLDSAQPGLCELERAPAVSQGPASDLWGPRCRRRPRGVRRLCDEPVGRPLSDGRRHWRRTWTHVIPFFAFPPDVRRVIYTTHALESVHARIRKIIKTRGHFPTDEAATNLIWLALRNITAEWVLPTRHWHAAMRQFAILYDEPFTVPRA